MKRAKIIKKRATIISIILGVCLLGAIGWGIFNYISLGQTIEQQQGEITLLSIQKGDLQNEIQSLKKQLIDWQSRYTILQTDWQSQYSDLYKQLEAATFRLGKDMPVKPTPVKWFDCDDSALYMYYYFRNMGYEVKIIDGNLDLVGESFLQSNHAWVLVKSGGYDYPYDWGHYYTDAQHYEGYYYEVTQLVLAVLADYDLAALRAVLMDIFK